MASCHLVTNGELALGGDKDADLFHHAGVGGFFAALDFVEVALTLHIGIAELLLEGLDDIEDLVADRARVDLDGVVAFSHMTEHRFGDLLVRADERLAGLAVNDVERDFLVEEDVGEALGELLSEIFLLLAVVLFDLLDLALVLRRGELFFVGISSRTALGDTHIHHDAGAAGRHTQ